MYVCKHAFVCVCVDINGLQRFTARVYRRGQANMRGQSTSYSTLLTCVNLCLICNSQGDVPKKEQTNTQKKHYGNVMGEKQHLWVDATR